MTATSTASTTISLRHTNQYHLLEDLFKIFDSMLPGSNFHSRAIVPMNGIALHQFATDVFDNRGLMRKYYCKWYKRIGLIGVIVVITAIIVAIKANGPAGIILGVFGGMGLLILFAHWDSTRKEYGGKPIDELLTLGMRLRTSDKTRTVRYWCADERVFGTSTSLASTQSAALALLPPSRTTESKTPETSITVQGSHE